MTRRVLLTLTAAFVCTTPALAQTPRVDKVEPPNWWADHSINPVRLLIRGAGLTGARMECGAPITCGGVRVNEAGSYVFADVTLPHGLPAGSYPLTLRTAGGTTSVPFRVEERLPPEGRFQGFGADDVFYLLMPDRFTNGDASNDDTPKSPGLIDRTRGRHYHGGDLAGVRLRLPYLKELGITTIWMNPIYDNTDHMDTKEVYDGQATTAYHGYHAIDYYAVDEHLGDMQELRRLVDEAHAHGIKIVLDMVANHSSAYHPWVADPPTPTWYNGSAGDHLANTWQIWTLADPYATPALREATLDGWFIDILPDLNQNDPETARYIIQNTLWWVGMSGIDGIRQDTWPYVPRAFWRDWMLAIRRAHPTLRVVGEVFDGDPALVSFFQGGRTQFDGIDGEVESLFDFPLFFPMRRAFAGGQPLREVAMMLSRDHLYPDADALVTFIGLHDVSRFMNEPGATRQGLELAFTFLLTARGIPLIYYGDEIAMPGGNDPDNRRDFPGGWTGDPRDAFTAAGRTPDEQAVWTHVQKLLRLRAARPELRRGEMEHLLVGEQVYVYRRGRSLIALNNDTAVAEVRLPFEPLGDDALGACGTPRREAEVVVITMPPRRGCVF